MHNGDNWIIRNNIFRNFRTTSGLAGPALLMWNGSSGTITEGNTFINNHRDIAYGLDSANTTDHAGGIIRNNFISRPSGAGGDVAIGVFNSANTQVLHNTVRMNGTYGSAMEYRFRRHDRRADQQQPDRRRHQPPATAHTGTVSGNITNAQIIVVRQCRQPQSAPDRFGHGRDRHGIGACRRAHRHRRPEPAVRAGADDGADEIQVASGMMAAFRFDEGSGTTVGSAVGALSGTISGTSWSTAGKYGNALSFNGTNSWVTVADDASLDLTTGMTLEALGSSRRRSMVGKP